MQERTQMSWAALGETLQPRHRQALVELLAWVPQIVAPAGVVVSGSIVRGNPGPSSDLDVVILHDGAWRRRVQRRFNGVPAELFFNSHAWLLHAIHSEADAGRPVMAHMLATGVLLADPRGAMADLQRLASERLQRGPGPDEQALTRKRYAAATLVEDALDFIAEPDVADAAQARALAVEALVAYHSLQQGQFLPRLKERVALLSQADPALAALLRQALTGSGEQASDALRAAADRILGVSGFFEWDSGIDPTPPPVAEG
ncbi:hypothetical protein EA658_10180 [Pseudoxanthomonas winnipegensis]|jgi:hypothetical protein|uniref:Polymerase nucleotidyl transferase domain-containing protein n=2 Tax=Pseudoxanthomonas winnipegensis TaxID=2480810 RepID=A0ABY1WCY2_9GAMM|nr:hypothetical protein EA659_03470 [Pseudoxanthomonas winnipegensis]TAA19230.1 hypothetical protein EA658_10180 [Pseudoxanthomonas winnipegensis]TAH70490.1 hypothetical protein EA657_17245 [Pseudoxanthomonas winnipegensis]